MKTILITGANGFIGSFLVEEALKNGYKVFAGIRKSSNLQYLAGLDIEFLELDYSNKESIKTSLQKQQPKSGRFDYIIHNAGITKTLRKTEFDTINYQHTINLVEVLIETESVPDKFIYMSSLAAYGPGNELTLAPVKESDTPSPVTLYGESKYKSERFITSIKDFPYLIFRPTGVYGPREKDYLVMYQMINRHIETYIGTSDQRITFIYIKDLANLIFRAIASDITRKSYFVTDGNQYTTQGFSDIVKSLLKKKTLRLVFPKAVVKPIAYSLEKLSAITGKVPTLNSEKYKEISSKNYLCDSSPLFTDFGFVAGYDLTEGLIETIDWCKNEKLL